MSIIKKCPHCGKSFEKEFKDSVRGKFKAKFISTINFSCPYCDAKVQIKKPIRRFETEIITTQGKYENIKNIEISPWKDRLDHLRVVVKGIRNTPYENGVFIFEVKMPSNYPYSPPKVSLHTRIWHPHIAPTLISGKQNICLDIINPSLVGKVDAQTGASGWTPSKTLSNVIEALIGLIHMQPPFWNPNNPLNGEAGAIALNDPETFARKAREWTYKYAHW